MLIVAAIAMIALGLAACGGGSNTSSSSESTESTEAPAEEATGEGAEEEVAETSESGGGDAITEAQEMTKELEQIPTEIASAEFGSFEPKPEGTLFYVSCDQAIEGCVVAGDGVRAAAAALGYHLEHCYEHLSNPQSGEECMAQAVTAKPDVILAQGVSMNRAGKAFAEAEAAEIPVISMFAAEEPGAFRYEMSGAGSCEYQGEILGSFVVGHSEGNAHVLAAYAPEFPCVPKRLAGFETAVSKCSSCSTKGLQFAAASVQTQFPQQLQAELQSDHEINYLAGLYSEPALLGAQTIRQLGLEVDTVGFDSSKPNYEAIKNSNTYLAQIEYGGVESGWMAADAAARLIAGQEVPKEFEPTSLLTTKNNIAKVGNEFQGAESFEQQYKELWSGS
jgi:ABC-type sugar transport system substrate-binding protein